MINKISSIKNAERVMVTNISHENNFGFLRLLFAYLVIISHSSELVYNSPLRELFHMITGSVTFGMLAVDGFFLISGYLIYQSYENSKNFSSYMVKRVLRIFPGFIVASFLSLIFVVALTNNPQLLSNLNLYEWVKIFLKALILSTPYVDGLLLNASRQIINGSIWTVRYEFFCYLFVPLIALLSFKKINILILTFLFLSICVYMIAYDVNYIYRNVAFFSLFQFFRMTTAFLVGTCFYKYRHLIKWKQNYVAFCFLALIFIRLVSTTFFELGLIILGGYIMFNFAFIFKSKMLEKIGAKTDISYGVYLYAWPIQIVIIHHFNSVNPWLLSAITILLASVVGYISWISIEKPFMNINKRFIKREAINA